MCKKNRKYRFKSESCLRNFYFSRENKNPNHRIDYSFEEYLSLSKTRNKREFCSIIYSNERNKFNLTYDLKRNETGRYQPKGNFKNIKCKFNSFYIKYFTNEQYNFSRYSKK